MEAVPRAAFVAPRHAGLASRNMALPTGCGQTVPEPLFVARMLGGARLLPQMRVLAIGLGSGYAVAILSYLVDHVVAVDRFASLVDAASARIADAGRDNVETRWEDGLDLGPEAPFDRLLVFGAVDPLPPRLWALVKDGAAVLHGRAAPPEPETRHRQVLVRVERQGDGIGRQTILCPSRLAPLRPGRVGNA
jgi:protein-L-isoaspartate(D-aspartate) O-methyltransferase